MLVSQFLVIFAILLRHWELSDNGNELQKRYASICVLPSFTQNMQESW